MKNKKIHFFFNFAGFSCKIIGERQEINYIKKCYLKSPFAKFIKNSLVKNTPLAILELNPKKAANNIDIFKLKSNCQKLFFKLECSENVFFLFPIIEQILRKIFYTLFFKNNGFIMHASAIIHKKKALIFAGPSGAGKSTVSKILSHDSFFQPIADNNVYVRKEKNNFFIYKSPFLEWNVVYKNQISPNDKFLIHKVFILKKAKRNKIKKISFKKAVNRIARQVQLPLSALNFLEIERSRRLIFEFISKKIDKNILELGFQNNNSIINKLRKSGKSI